MPSHRAPSSRESSREPSYRLVLGTVLCLALFLAGAANGGAPGVSPRVSPRVAPGAVETVSDGMRVPERSDDVIADAPDQVRTGETIVISGKVRRAPRSRVVRVALRGPGGWQELSRKRSTRSGRFWLKTFAGELATTLHLRVRVSAPGRRTVTLRTSVEVVAPAGTTQTPVAETPTVEPEAVYDPTDVTVPATGSSTDWSYLLDSSSGRWDPCTPIGWGFDETGGYPGSLDDLRTAVAGVASRTGLTFVHQGAVGDHLNIVWFTEAADARLAGTVAGYGGATAMPLHPGSADVAHQLVRGRMVLDAESPLRPGFHASGSPTWGQVMLHELMHVVGLGHAGGRDQVMFPSASGENHRLGAGDLGGLRAVGATLGCLPPR